MEKLFLFSLHLPYKNCFWAVVFNKILESPLDYKEIKPVNPKGNQSWIFIRRTDAKAEAPMLWPHDRKNWLIGKDPDAGKDWRQEKKGMTEDEMIGWHHWLNGLEFEQAPGIGDGQGAWCAAVHGVAKSQTWLSDWTHSLTDAVIISFQCGYIYIFLQTLRCCYTYYFHKACV